METTKLQCPFCKGPLVTQVPPEGLMDTLAGLVSLHPFQCEGCKGRFRVKCTPDQVQRRKSVRVPVQVPVTFESKEVSGEGMLTDISMHGCTLVSKENLRSGLLLRLHIPDSKSGKPDSIRQQLATVMGVNGQRAGLKFLAYSTEERNSLAQTVTKSMKIFAS